MNQTQTITFIPAERLLPHPENPRKDLGDLTELADSIRAKGVLQNLTVVPIDKENPYTSYTVVIGHRRLAAAKLAGLATLPCIIADMTHSEQIETMLLENMARSDLTVYEQALGFQQLSMLGADVAQIAEKTGFSTSTVRRRLKMAELDHDLLREAATRQISLGDFDKLNQIDDLKTRNALLKKIGTPGFNYEVMSAVSQQIARQAKAGMKPWLEEAGLIQIEHNETWNGKWVYVGGVNYEKWEPGTSPIPDGKTPDAYSFGGGEVGFYKKAKVEKPKKTPEQVAREQYIAQTREKLSEIARTAYETRKEFIARLHVTAQNTPEILRGAFLGASWTMGYNSTSRDNLGDWLGLSEEEKKDWRSSEAYAKLIFEKGNREGINKTLPYAIWLLLFGDDASLICWTRYVAVFPEYEANERLNAVYDWLICLGYEMSDTERQMIDGTLPLFMDKDEPDTPKEEEEDFSEEDFDEEDWYGDCEEVEDDDDWADGVGQAFSPDSDEALVDALTEMYGGGENEDESEDEGTV